MGLYLCIFDEDGEDICGVEVGLYNYFEEFRCLISKYTNKGLASKVLKFYVIKPENLFECFIDSDCEFLIDRLIGLCDLAIQENRSIMFQ